MAQITPIGQVHSIARLVPIALLIGLLSMLSMSVAGQSVITTLTDGISTFTYFTSEVDLNQVISNATDNDTIILPGGPIPMNGTVTIDKPIVLIGAGYNTQGSPVTLPTIIPAGTGPFAQSIGFEVHEGGSGSSFHGIRFDRYVGHYGDVNSVRYARCEFIQAFSLSAVGVPFQMPSATNVQMRECIFHWVVDNGMSNNTLGLSIHNSILVGGLNMGYGTSSALVDHCTILGPGLNTQINEGVMYDHCAIAAASGPLTIAESACFQDCLFVLGNSATVNPNQCYAGQGNNVINASTQLDFVNVPVIELEEFSTAHDYHFAPGSQGLLMDVGIYGGLPGMQFKPQGIPFNPHWEALSVPPLTQGGVLTPTVISGEAQSY